MNKVIATIILASTITFFLGFLFGKFRAEPTVRFFSEPVAGVVAGEDMPVVSAIFFNNYVEIITDGGEKIVANKDEVIIYETEKYYTEKYYNGEG